jgi:DNA repair exonuclease SbcCD nuclease subunit
MKFIHAADIHLDSPLRGLERYDGAPSDEMRSATRKALENLVRLGIEEKVAFVLIVGDVYDGDWKDYNTGLFFARQMARLREADIKVFLIRGNHDAASQITRELALPENVYEFPSHKPESVLLEDLGIAIHGQSFPTQAVTEDLSASYPLAKDSLFNIGLLHTSAGGREGHENYAPCTVAGLLSKGYDYWALGHVHQREELQRDPWIVFPGNLQGRHARETGSKGCTLVSITDGAVRSVEHKSLDVARWCQYVVNTDGAADLDEILERTRRGLLAELDRAEGRLLAVRLAVRGSCRAHKTLAKQHDQFINECRALANDIGVGQVWIEKVSIQSQAEFDLDEIAKRQDPLGDLLRFMRSLPSDEATLGELLKEFRSLQQKLPLELRQGAEAMDLDDPSLLREILPEVDQILLSRLLEQDSKR